MTDTICAMERIVTHNGTNTRIVWRCRLFCKGRKGLVTLLYQWCIEPQSGERARNSWIVTKIRGYTHHLLMSKKGLWLMMKQPSRLRQSHFSTACSFLGVCRYSPRYNNLLLLFVFFQAQAWRVGCCDSFSD